MRVARAVVIGAAAAVSVVAVAADRPVQAFADHKDAEYLMADRKVRLSDGVSSVQIEPGTAARIVTRYFGNELRLDLDADGLEDIAFLVTQETGGSGTFFYLVAALNTGRGYVGSEALYLGDRITPRGVEGGNGLVVLYFATRAPGEPFTTPPGIGRSLYLKLDPLSLRFREVVVEMAGDADRQAMNLGIKTWTWLRTRYSNDVEIQPRATRAFTLTFEGTRFSATTDCNSLAGRYSADGRQISFSDVSATRMFCEQSQEDDFARTLLAASSYHFTSRGELVLDLKLDTGTAVFH